MDVDDNLWSIIEIKRIKIERWSSCFILMKKILRYTSYIIIIIFVDYQIFVLVVRYDTGGEFLTKKFNDKSSSIINFKSFTCKNKLDSIWIE